MLGRDDRFSRPHHRYFGRKWELGNCETGNLRAAAVVAYGVTAAGRRCVRNVVHVYSIVYFGDANTG